MGDCPITNQHKAGSRQGRQHRQAWIEAEEKSKPPSVHIDLYNFEDPKYENGKYVLTSPRSLDACGALAIKPVELLYRSLVDIQEELVPRGLPMRTIYSAYEESERERQNTLSLCREERQRLIEEEEERQDASRSGTAKRVTIKEDSADSGTEVDQEDIDDGSLQRQRTAWTTSIGHHRVTQEELEKRAQDLHARALALREATLGLPKTKKQKKMGQAKKTASKGGKSLLLVTGRAPRKAGTWNNKMALKKTGPNAGRKLR